MGSNPVGGIDVCLLSGRGLCSELITRSEESYRLWCVVVCDPETSRISAPYIYDISSLRVNHDQSLLLGSFVEVVCSNVIYFPLHSVQGKLLFHKAPFLWCM